MRNVKFFVYMSIFLISFSVAAYNPLIPIYAKLFGADYFDLGIIGSAYSLPYVIFPIIIGTLSEKYDRRYFYNLGIFLTTISTVLLIFTSNIDSILLVRIFGGLAFAFMFPTAEALLIDLSDFEERITVMGRYSFSWGLGFLLGPAFGGIILDISSFKMLFIICSMFGILAIFVAIRCIIKNRSYEIKKIFNNMNTSGSNKKNDRKNNIFTKKLIPLYILVIIYSIILGVLYSIFPAYANEYGISSFLVGIIFAFFGIVRTLIFLFSEKVSRVGINKVIILGLIVQSLALFILTYFVGIFYFIIVVVLIGFSTGIFSPLSLSLASNISPKVKTGLMMGLMETLFGLGLTIGPYSGGLIVESFGFPELYLSLAFLSILTVLPFVLIKYKKEK